MWLKFILYLELILLFALISIVNLEYFDKDYVESFVTGIMWTSVWGLFLVDYLKPNRSEK